MTARTGNGPAYLGPSIFGQVYGYVCRGCGDVAIVITDTRADQVERPRKWHGGSGFERCGMCALVPQHVRVWRKFPRG